MRPEAADIAVPPLPANLTWIGADRAPNIDRLVATGPVVVHFFDVAQLNSVRTLPYLRGWHERYRDAGVAFLGVHSPRFPCTAAEDAVRAGVSRHRIPYQVAIDSRFRVWKLYGCKGWPSMFVWGRGGALRWFHFGEGEYVATEEAIQELILESAPDSRLPDPLPPLRPSDAPGALVMPPSEEVFPGGSAERPWDADAGRRELSLAYSAGGAYVTADGDGTVESELDGHELAPIRVDVPGLYELVEHERHERHTLLVRPTAGVRVWSISFAAAA